MIFVEMEQVSNGFVVTFFKGCVGEKSAVYTDDQTTEMLSDIKYMLDRDKAEENNKKGE